MKIRRRPQRHHGLALMLAALLACPSCGSETDDATDAGAGGGLDASGGADADLADAADDGTSLSDDGVDDGAATDDGDDGPPGCTENGDCPTPANPCMAGVCHATLGCILEPRPDDSACDDGDACSGGDTCHEGKCGGTSWLCGCKDDDECAQLEDGDLCNGTLRCDKAVTPAVCSVDANTVVACESPKDAACKKHFCEPETGQCAALSLAEGAACEDGDSCTTTDTCQDGKCTAGTFTCACKTNADCAPLDDGNLCNGTLVCDTSGAAPVCKANPASVVFCPSIAGKPCLEGSCQPATGKCAAQPVADGSACDNGDACSTSDVCIGGVCKGLAVDCDDGNACTVDSCSTSTGACSHDGAPADGSGCNADDNGCTTNDVCVTGACTAGANVQCEGAVAVCMTPQCIAKGPDTYTCAAVPLPDGATCTDDDLCTSDDACLDGACEAAPTDCDDGEACTGDACDTQSGCGHVALDLPGCPTPVD